MYTLCTVHVQLTYIHSSCASHTHLICSSFTAHVHLMHISCTSMCVSCTSHMQLMYRSCIAHVHLMHTSCTSHVCFMHNPCTAHAQLMYTPCTAHKHLMHNSRTAHVHHTCSTVLVHSSNTQARMKPLHSVHTHLSLLRVSMSTVAPLHSFWVHVPSHVVVSHTPWRTTCYTSAFHQWAPQGQGCALARGLSEVALSYLKQTVRPRSIILL